jgi:hypothetical protein
VNVSIEKISNGYVVTIDGKKTFCDVPAAICGLTSEAVLETCTRLDNKTDYVGDAAKVLLKQIDSKRLINRAVYSSFDAT